MAQELYQPTGLKVAQWGRRVVAHIIDALIVKLPLFVFVVGPAMAEVYSKIDTLRDPLTGRPDQQAISRLARDMATGGRAGLALMLSILGMVYYIALHATRGQTIGKIVMKMKVVKVDGSPAGWDGALKRALVFPIAAAIPRIGGLVYLLNGFWPLWDDRRQSLGDKVGGTLVVDA
jgi:uncharacterized RDD family membrane protein YckC